MKNLLTKIVLFVVLLAAGQMYAQTETNVEALMQLSAQFDAQWKANQIKVQKYAAENKVAIFEELPDGRARQMVDIRDGKPVYYITYNLEAAKTTRAAKIWPDGGAGLNVSGEGYNQLGEWDAGHVRKTHQEFTDQGASRATPMDGNYATHYHATHVAGTMIAAGVVGNAKGMAYAANLKYWQWSNDNSEMAAAAANGLELSNHSYGFGTGWEWNGSSWHWVGNSSVSPTEDYKFGFYSGDSKAMDQIAFNAPNYLIVQAAGNDRGEGPGDAGQNGKPEKDGGDDGYDCIGPEEIAKNVMTVGAVKKVLNYTGPADVKMSDFSSWGPADDGRIKPDIVGKGVDVYSTMDGSNTAYASLQGTSMACPNVTGSMALLQKHYQDTHSGIPMRSATLKGLVIHTADEAGDNPGPDYIFGWGLMNTQKAAHIISDDVGQVVIDERVLEGGDLYVRNISVPEGTDELRVTICWTDPPAIPTSPQLNPRTPMLVNDLDLEVIDASSTHYFPYKLDPEDPSAAATTDSKNAVDNVESIYIESPAAGNYTIRISHDGSLQGGEQAYSLIINGIEEYTVVPECSAGMVSPEDGADEILTNQWFSWMPANFATSYDVYFGTDGGGTETPTNVFNGENFKTNGFSTVMDPSTTYYLQVVPRNNMGAATGCDDIYTFTTLDAITEYPYLQQMLGVVVPEPPAYWQTVDNSEAIWQSTNMIGHGDSRSMICWNTSGVVETDYDNWFVSPPFEVVEGNEYYVSSYYKSFSTTKTETISMFWGETPDTEDLTNLLFEDVDFSDPGWRKGGGLYTPDSDGLVYFGWQVSSTNGFGLFLDEILVENWGPVGIEDRDPSDIVRIYNRGNQVMVLAGENWNGADLKVMNTMGQIMYSGQHFDQSSIQLNSAGTGLYIVTLQKGNKVETKKLIVR
jgi:hypothetical protein